MCIRDRFDIWIFIAIPVRRSDQLSYEATDVGSWSFVGSNEHVRNECEVIYEKFHILNCKWPASNISGFIAQLVRASHWYREVTGSNPVEVLNFSGFCISSCINGVHKCEDHNLRDVYVSLRRIVRRTLYDRYSPYFLPELMVRFTRRARGHFVMLI